MSETNHVRLARTLAKLSQNQLARKAGLSQYTISTIESGDDPDPRYSVVCAIADALGISESNLGFSRRRDRSIAADDRPRTKGRRRRAKASTDGARRVA